MLCRLVEAYGFDPCAGHQRGRSFLFFAAKGKHLDMMRFLLHLGLTANCLNRVSSLLHNLSCIGLFQ